MLRLAVAFFLAFVLFVGFSPTTFADERIELFKDKTRNVAVSAEFVPTVQPEGRMRFLPGSIAVAPVSSDPATAASQFISGYASEFGARLSGATLGIVGMTSDDTGYTHVKFEQKYQGYPVINSEINVHIDPSGKVTGAIGRIARIVSFATRKKVPAAQARQTALKAWRKLYPKVSPSISVTGPYVYVPQHMNPRASRIASLVWVARAASDVPPMDYYYVIDASTGRLAQSVSGARYITRLVGDCTPYSTTKLCGNYELFSPDGTYRYGRREVHTTPAGTNPTYGGSDVDDVWNLLPQFDTFLMTKFGRNGLNGYGGSYEPTEQYNYVFRVFTYLEGISGNGPYCGTFYNGTVQICKGGAIPDILAHESMHGLMMYNYNGNRSIGSGLNYTGQSGAIEEAAADIVAAAFESYVNGTTDWKLQKHRDVSQGFHRDLSNPHAIIGMYGGAHPARVGEPEYYCGGLDNSGVHHNSTVISHAVYYMSNGGIFNGTHINGIGIDRAVQIAFRAFTTFSTTSPNIATAANALIQACQALYPGMTPEDICNQVRVAVFAAEMDKPECAGATAVNTSIVSCSDSDGENYLTSGVVQADGYEFKDRCVGNVLTEQTCLGSGSTRMAKVKLCARGCADAFACNL